MTIRNRVKTLEGKATGRSSGQAIHYMTDRQLARAAGSPWLLACTDDELMEIAKGVERTNPARFNEIMTLAISRSAEH